MDDFRLLLGLIPVVTTVLGLMKSQKSHALAWLLVGNVFFLAQYVLGGAWPQAMLYVINTTRIFVFWWYDRSGKHTPAWWLGAFMAPGLIMSGIALAQSQDWWVLVTATASAVATWGTWQQLPQKMRWLRASFAVAPALNLAFDATHGFTGWVPYALQAGSSLFLLILLWRREKKPSQPSVDD